MPEISEVLQNVVEQVLETMFFSTVLGPGADPEVCPCFTADVAFAGSEDGILQLSVSRDTAQALTASFLGAPEEDLPLDQVQATLGELANVICGAVLGRVYPLGRFVISPPTVAFAPPGAGAVRNAFTLPEGLLLVGFSVGVSQ